MKNNQHQIFYGVMLMILFNFIIDNPEHFFNNDFYIKASLLIFTSFAFLYLSIKK